LIQILPVKVNFQALGCRLNEAELDVWARQFALRGHELTSNSAQADLVIFNSCSVTAEADRKSRKLINRARRLSPQANLVVTGCYASLQNGEVGAHPAIDLVVDNQSKDQLVDLVVERLEIADGDLHLQQEYSVFSRGRHRAFIKVQDGCRYRCTYCVVTLARGEERSRSIEEIVGEIKFHVQHGVQEAVLAGVHVGGYGSDTGDSLYRLISEILERTSLPRLRLASVEPWDLPDNFFELFSDPRLMPHMHLPLQSGSDSVLRRMARRCKTAEFERLVDKARSAVPLFNVTTDLIVGFPGESEQEWQQTVRFVERVGFGDMHVFPFSARAGTKAATLPGQVDGETRRQRGREMRELANRMQLAELQKHVGNSYPVLWEKQLTVDSPRRVGYTPHYHKVVSSPHPPAIGSANLDQQVRIAALDRDALVLRQDDLAVAFSI
jgi:threonylcarbamoyladenosine tRNA methylthiotransferase MtaB